MSAQPPQRVRSKSDADIDYTPQGMSGFYLFYARHVLRCDTSRVGLGESVNQSLGSWSRPLSFLLLLV